MKPFELVYKRGLFQRRDSLVKEYKYGGAGQGFTPHEIECLERYMVQFFEKNPNKAVLKPSDFFIGGFLIGVGHAGSFFRKE